MWRRALGALSVFGGGSVGYVLGNNTWRPQHTCMAETESSGSEEKCFSRSFVADAVEQVAPAVVTISSVTAWSIFRGASAGSGFIIDSSGKVLTNAHVVMQSEGITVTFSDGSVRKASVLGVDRPSDIALLQIHKDDSLPFPCVSFGDSEKVRTGDFVIALGAPGMLRNSVSLGIVSATRQSSELGLPGQATSYIQTDAAINVGNSGGPLINADGQVIGINTMKAAELQGISFAIPINLAREIVNELLKHGRVRRPFIGLSVLPLRRDMVRFQKAEDPNFPDVDHGLLVVEVIPGSPADRAGLRPGDCILAIDGRDISSKADLHNIIGFDVERIINADVVKWGNLKTTVQIKLKAA